MDPSWDDLRTVLTLVRHGTLARAAKDLGVAYTTVSRRIDRLEEALGQTVFERLPDGYVPTEFGLIIAGHAEKMELNGDAMLRELKGKDGALRGPLVLTAPQLLIAHHLCAVIEDFTREHPEVDLQIRATNEPLDLNRREADLAIRISHEPGDSLMGQELVQQHSASFATPKIAKAIEADPTAPIDWIVYDQLPDVPKAVDRRFPNQRVKLRFDDMVAMIGAAQAGLGVIRTPVFLGRATAGLVQVPVLPPQDYPPIWVVAHRDVWPSARVAAFRQLLFPYMRAHRDAFLA